MAKKEPATFKMYGMSIGKWMTGLFAFPFGVIFHYWVALFNVNLTASTTAETNPWPTRQLEQDHFPAQDLGVRRPEEPLFFNEADDQERCHGRQRRPHL